MRDNFDSFLMKDYRDEHASLSFLGPQDNGTKALGVCRGDDCVAAALVSTTGMRRVWFLVKQGSSAVEHIPNISDFREHIVYYGPEFNFDRTLASIHAQSEADLVGTDATKAEHRLAWSFAQRTGFGFYGPLAGLARYYWKAAEKEAQKSVLDKALSLVLRSSDDLTVVTAILNGLVALGAAEQETKHALRIAREAELNDAISQQGPAQNDWPWVALAPTLHQGKRIRVAPDVARELVEMGAANYI